MEKNLFQEEKIRDKKYFERYLLQINRIKLQDYIQCGLIVPDQYLDDEHEFDIQSKNPNILVVSEGYIDELNEHQILLDLILTDTEIEKLHFKEDVCFIDFPLPITRIKKIYVQDKKIAKHICIQMENSEKGFLPNKLFDVYLNRKKSIFENKQYFPIVDEISTKEFEEKIRIFNSRMGMFSFMKNTHLYYADETNLISNYSDNYFSALSSLWEEQLTSSRFFQLDVLKNNKLFKELLYSDNQIDKDFLEKIAIDIENVEIRTLFIEMLKPTGTREVLSKFVEKNLLEYYIIGLVYYFRQKDSNKKDSFKTEIKNLIPYKFADISLAILGIYLGYKNLRAIETININDNLFKKIFGKKFNIKFKLDTKLDYMTIESIYEFSFNGRKGYEFEYIQDINEKQNVLKIPKSDKNFKVWYEIVEESRKIDVDYIKIKKKTFEEIIIKKLEKYPENLTPLNHYLFSFVFKYLPEIISPIKIGEKLEISCYKHDLLERIRFEENKSKRNELFSLFELDKQ